MDATGKDILYKDRGASHGTFSGSIRSSVPAVLLFLWVKPDPICTKVARLRKKRVAWPKPTRDRSTRSKWVPEDVYVTPNMYETKTRSMAPFGM